MQKPNQYLEVFFNYNMNNLPGFIRQTFNEFAESGHAIISIPLPNHIQFSVGDKISISCLDKNIMHELDSIKILGCHHYFGDHWQKTGWSTIFATDYVNDPSDNSIEFLCFLCNLNALTIKNKPLSSYFDYQKLVDLVKAERNR